MPEPVKSERLATLQQLLNAQQVAFNQAAIGKTVPVLLDRRGRRDGQLLGRSPHMQSVHIDADDGLYGRIVDVAIEAAHANSLAGRLAAGPDRAGEDGSRANNDTHAERACV